MNALGFDVFLSYNGADRDAVLHVKRRLEEAGLKPWFDKDRLVAGRHWQDGLLQGLQQCGACVVFVGSDHVNAWAREEVRVAIDRAARDSGYPIIPVLLPGVADPFEPSRLPPFLSSREWVDLRKGLDDPNEFPRLLHGIRGDVAVSPQPLPTLGEVCPYLGLRAFGEEDSGLFFGRQGDIQRLIEKLKESRFLAVLGPSGSGKSSVVRAGLIPAVRRGGLPCSDTWIIIRLTPKFRPLEELAHHLVALNPARSMSDTIGELERDERALHFGARTALAARPAGTRIVCLVDQFEEVFTLCSKEEERRQFIKNLAFAGLVPDGPAVVVLTMRADFYPQCARYPELAQAIVAHQYLVGPMGAEGLREAIEAPARLAGGRFEAGLVASILEDVKAQPGALPLLEHALFLLWARQVGGLLTFDAYQAIGGVEGAIAQHAERIYEGFDEKQKEIAKRIMLRLTKPGQGTEDTRQRTTIDELVTHEDKRPAVEAVVKALADARLLTVS